MSRSAVSSYTTRGAAQCFILETARNASLINGLKHVLYRPILYYTKRGILVYLDQENWT